jgi:Domain of unknown function (DUF6456)
MSRRIKPDAARGRELEEVRGTDPDGRPVLHHRVVDPLDRMLRAGTISDDMHTAARDLQADFTIARFDRLRAPSLLRIPGMARDPDMTSRELDARRRVHEAMEALGGISSPAGSIVWHVLGLEQSVREWALRQGWGGRPVDQKEAKGIFVAALGVLASNPRYSGSRRAS